MSFEQFESIKELILQSRWDDFDETYNSALLLLVEEGLFLDEIEDELLVPLSRAPWPYCAILLDIPWDRLRDLERYIRCLASQLHHDYSRNYVSHVLSILVSLGEASAFTAPELIRCYRASQYSMMKIQILKALVDIHAPSELVLTFLMEECKTKDFHAFPFVAQALGSLGEEAAPALPLLENWLDNPRPELQAPALEAIGFIGKPARYLKARIEDFVVVPHPVVQVHSVFAHAAISGEPRFGIDQLRRLLGSDEDHWGAPSRSMAAIALGRLGHLAAGTIPDLLYTIQQDTEGLGTASIHAIGAIGTEAEIVVPVLRELLFHSSLPVLLATHQALTSYADDAPIFVDSLIDSLFSFDFGNREDNIAFIQSSCLLLSYLGEKASGAVIKLCDFLEQSEALEEKQSVIATLGLIGDSSERVLQVLQSMSESHPVLQYESSLSLLRLGHRDEQILDSLLNLVKLQVPSLPVFGIPDRHRFYQDMMDVALWVETIFEATSLEHEVDADGSGMDDEFFPHTSPVWLERVQVVEDIVHRMQRLQEYPWFQEDKPLIPQALMNSYFRLHSILIQEDWVPHVNQLEDSLFES